MNALMPSEIARLVLGYLKETKCEQTVGMFLNESPHLREYVECLLQGQEFSTSINGKSLLDILKDYVGSFRDSSKTNETSAICSRSLLLSARSQHKQNSLISVGCGGDGVDVRQSSCQTSPPFSLEIASSVQAQNTHRTPSKCVSTTTAFTTPTCQPLDFYSTPSSLLKPVLLNFQGPQTTPLKCQDMDNHSLECRTNSPRRKDPLPRKRLYSPRGQGSAKKRKENVDETTETVEIEVENSNAVYERVGITQALIDGTLNNPVLQERIAANINDVMGAFAEQPYPVVSNSETTNEETVYEQFLNNIVTKVKSKPSYEDILNDLCEIADGYSRELTDVGLKEHSDCELRRNEEQSTGEVSVRQENDNNVGGSVTYLFPLGVENESGPMYQLVLGTANDQLVLGTTNDVYTSNHSTTPSKNGEKQFATLSPGDLFAVAAAVKAPEATLKEINKPKNVLRKCNPKANEPLKKAFIRRHCAVKSLNFNNTQANVKNVTTSKVEQVTVRPRLKSLLKKVETLEGNKNNSDGNEKTKKNEDNNKKKSIENEAVSKKKDGDQEGDGKNIESTTQVALSKMNVDEFLTHSCTFLYND